MLKKKERKLIQFYYSPQRVYVTGNADHYSDGLIKWVRMALSSVGLAELIMTHGETLIKS